MEFRPSKRKNVDMPACHISSQSFDEILSDLGDDPAIPDPHGIRKPPHQGAPKDLRRKAIITPSKALSTSLNFQAPFKN